MIIFCLQNIIKKVNGQKFVYKFVQFPENFDIKDIKVSQTLSSSNESNSSSPPAKTLHNSRRRRLVGKFINSYDFLHGLSLYHTRGETLIRIDDNMMKIISLLNSMRCYWANNISMKNSKKDRTQTYINMLFQNVSTRLMLFCFAAEIMIL